MTRKQYGMGLFDGYSNPPPWPESGGLLARLLAVQQEQRQYQPGAGFGSPVSTDTAQTPSALPLPSSSPLAALLAPSSSWPTPSASAVNSGQMSGGAPAATPDLYSQYQSLRPILGDQHAMTATVHPEIGKSLIAQALANQQASGNAGSTISVDYHQPLVSDASSAQNLQNGPLPNASTSKSAKDSIGSALSDFYHQTILQAGKDISGYVTDAVNDPAAFSHAVGPSSAGLSPIVSEVPAVARGVLGLFGTLRRADVPPLPDKLIGINPRYGENRTKTDLRGTDTNPKELFNKLTGGRYETDSDGTRIGPNGVRLRPSTGEGPRIDIPANGPKEHETIHFPEADQ